MKRISTLLFAAVALAGCEEAPAPEIVRTVDWFKENEAEREAQIAKCNSNPGELDLTPNCINAKRAGNLADAAKRGGLDVKPIPGLKMGGK